MVRLSAVVLFLATTLHAQTNVVLSPEMPSRRVIVEFQPAGGLARAATLERFRRDLGSSVTAERQGVSQSAAPVLRYEYTHALLGAAIDAPPAAVEAIRRLPYVRAVYPDRTVTAYAVPGRAIPTAAAAIDAAARVNAASLATRGEGMRIGIIDTGVDYTHPALGGGFGPGYKVAGGWDFVNNNGDPKDDAGHGTHVAGIIAADSGDITGVAPAATLIAYKVLNAAGAGQQSDVIAAIERSIDPNQDGDPADHLDVINLSLGGPGTADDLLSHAVDNATAAGVVVVVAAGNAGALDTIGSPGAARTAITVGALDASLTSAAAFSSRGPSPGVLGFKPDVMAPGSAIPSTYLNKIIVQLDGTSMAAPHVTGAAALLRKLHPSWTPAEIKSALVTTATKVNDTPLARAAGRVDAARADAATELVDGAGISFGLSSAKSGAWEAVRKVSVTNRAAEARTFDVVPTNVPAGATLTATPAQLQLAPGESKSVELRLAIDGAATAFPVTSFIDGDIEFRGTGGFTLPWFVARGARITVSYDQPAAAVAALSATSVRQPFLYDLGKAEIFTTPDAQWDILLLAYDLSASPTAARLAFAENVTASGDVALPLHRDDTSKEIVLDERDSSGVPFTQATSQINRLRTLRFLYAKQPGLLVNISIPDVLTKLFASPLSTTFTLYIFDGYFDVHRGRAYNIQHPPLAGISQPVTLSAGPQTYKHVTVHFPQPKSGPNAAFACQTTGVTTPVTLSTGLSGCSPVELGPAMVLDYFATEESAAGLSGMDFDMVVTAIGMLRVVDGSIVPAPWIVPSPAAYRIADQEEITLGTSALYPFAFFGTAPNQYIGSMPGFIGPLGEWYRYVTVDTPWAAFDAANMQVATGTYSNLTTCDEGPCDPGPTPQPGGRYVVSRDGINVGGQAAHGDLEVRFGSDPTDLIAPTLTTMRLLNGQGRLAQRLERNGNGSLFFAAADLAYPADPRKLGSTRDLKREATRVSYRTHGTAAWIPLTPVHQGSDLGSVIALHRFPVGEMYLADLSAVTRTGAEAIDLRIEIEDVAGNHTTWTESPAIVIAGEAPPPAPKRRAVRP